MESKINLRDLKGRIGEIFSSYATSEALTTQASSGVVEAGARAGAGSGGGGSGAAIDELRKQEEATSDKDKDSKARGKKTERTEEEINNRYDKRNKTSEDPSSSIIAEDGEKLKEYESELEHN